MKICREQLAHRVMFLVNWRRVICHEICTQIDLIEKERIKIHKNSIVEVFHIYSMRYQNHLLARRDVRERTDVTWAQL